MTAPELPDLIARHDERMKGSVLWDITVKAVRLPDGNYLVRVVGNQTGKEHERVGKMPLWDLIRILGGKSDDSEVPKGT